MTGMLEFGALLTHLRDHRSLDAAALAAASGVDPLELQAVSDGRTPTEGLLRGLAPALGLHAADLFVLAGRPVPDDLAPVTRKPDRSVSRLVYDLAVMPAENRRPLLDAIRAQPQDPLAERGGLDRPHYGDEPGFGSVLLELARSRHLTTLCTAKSLHAVTDGRIYLAAATIGGIGRGTVETTPELVAGFAGVLGIPAADLAALGGIPLPDDLPPLHPRATDVAALIWETRRLTGAQLDEISLTSRHLANRG
ncbi:hypothetical protein [Kitasatospora sp. NPDC097691]|uniref:hypothetical protein n=1 Tax=Kitasatospora sp. NPDC097691 TaxID=3157231 RepID=UPI0033168CA4